MKQRLLYALVLAGGLVFAAGADAQNINTLETRMSRLENEIQTLSRAVFRGDVPPPQFAAPAQSAQTTAAMEIRLGQIEEQLQRLTGRIEETQYTIRQLEGKLNDFTAQTTSRLNAAPSDSVPAPDAAADYSETPQPSSEQQADSGNPYRLGTLNGSDTATPAGLYDKAFSYLQTNDYAAAEDMFRDFIARYPDHSLVSNAKYWLGETYYARGDYTGASRAFARAFQDHADSQKAPDMLLKLGMALANQDKKEEACLTFAELEKRYPMAPASVTQTAEEEQQSLGCGG